MNKENGLSYFCGSAPKPPQPLLIVHVRKDQRPRRFHPQADTLSDIFIYRYYTMRPLVLISVLCIGILSAVPGQSLGEPATLSMAELGPYSIVERSDWSRYDNGRYVGLVSQEVRATIFPQRTGNSPYSSLLFQGSFYVLESMIREVRLSARELNAVIPVQFELKENGAMKIDNDRGYPTMRG